MGSFFLSEDHAVDIVSRKAAVPAQIGVMGSGGDLFQPQAGIRVGQRDSRTAQGGVSEDLGKVLYGGPMMGISICKTSDPILKTTNAITAFRAKDALPKPTTPCIHCGRCVDACPMRLNPTQYSKALRLPSDEMVALLTEEKLGLCIECGCCSFVCPAGRPLAENNRIAKAKFKAHLSANPVAVQNQKN